MKKLTFLLLAVFLANGQQQKTPITIESIFNESSMVFSGQVVDKQSYWDVDRKMIYTVHRVKVSKSFKGNQNQIVYVLKEGGVVGLQGVVVKPSFKIEKESTGFFMVKNSPSIKLDGFVESDKLMVLSSGIKGFFYYDAYDKSVHIPGNPKKSLKVFESDLQKLSKKKARVVDGFFSENLFFSQTSASSSLISSISPSIIAAGNKEVLTIKGSEFGEFELDGDYGRVSFSNADSGGNSWIYSLKTQIVSWSDTEIKVEVPSDSGSGEIRIIRSDGTVIESSLAIEIPYSIQAIIYPENGEDDEKYEYPIYHSGSISDDILNNGEIKDNISNGAYQFTFNKDFYDNIEARDAFDYHLRDWVCSTGLNFNIDENTTPKSGAFSDFKNIVSFGDIDALGITYSYFDGCVIRDGDDNIVDLQLVWSEIDIVFNETVLWGYNDVTSIEYDFNSVSKHEIGHALGFGHNINSNSLMHYNVSTGPQTTSLDPYLSGAAAILQRDVSTSLCDVLEPLQIAECSTIDPGLDSDQDGVNDIFDICPDTPLGAETNNKGCSESQLDDDEDGVTNDIDECEGTPIGSLVNDLGCADSDDDGITDNIDICSNTEISLEVNEQGCAAYQRDTDEDGVTDDFDLCDDTPEGSSVDVNGCTIFSLPSNNFNVFVESLSCIDSNDGSIQVSVLDQSFSYEVRIAENNYPLTAENDYKYLIENLGVGTFDICFAVDGYEYYEQCFKVNLRQPEPLEVFTIQSVNEVRFEVNGSAYYNVRHNDKEMIFYENTFEIPLKKGLNNIRIFTDLDCQGVYEETYFNGNEVFVYPSIIKDNFNIIVQGLDSFAEVIIHDYKGRKLSQEKVFFSNKRTATLSLKDLPNGVYFLSFQSSSIQCTKKIIKK